METIVIDGGFGEGGGQIIRSALTYSVIQNRSIELINIRKNRPNPGLRPQHLTAARLLAKISNATLEGAVVGSSKIRFIPNEVVDSRLNEEVGTAGSISLILQVLIPAVAISKHSLDLKIKGGTDVRWSPTIDYTRFVLFEAYKRMGIHCNIRIRKRGYYPKGGGSVQINVEPVKRIKPIVLQKRTTSQAKIFCSYYNIPQDLINREIKKIELKLKQKSLIVNTETNVEQARERGGSILVYNTDEKSIIGVDSLFENGFNSDIAKRFLDSGLGVDENLADMIVLPASLAQGQSVFSVPRITKHLETNLYVASKMTDCKYGIGKLSEGFEVRINEN